MTNLNLFRSFDGGQQTYLRTFDFDRLGLTSGFEDTRIRHDYVSVGLYVALCTREPAS
jgi:hypothetical protein